MLGLGTNKIHRVTPNTGEIISLIITDGGDFTGVGDGNYTATQGTEFTSSGSGTGAILSVTISSTVITAIAAITNGGAGHLVGDVFTITELNSVGATSNAILTIDKTT